MRKKSPYDIQDGKPSTTELKRQMTSDPRGQDEARQRRAKALMLTYKSDNKTPIPTTTELPKEPDAMLSDFGETLLSWT